MRELPYDPCPGDVAGVRGLARWCRDQADDLSRAASVVAGWSAPDWHGSAAVAARERVDEVGRAARASAASLGGAAEALEGWACRLEDLQARADALDAEAVVARRELERRRAVGAEPTAVLEHGLVGVLQAQRDLDRVVDRARALQGDYDAAARQQAGALDACAPADRGALSRWWRGSWDAGEDRWRVGVRRDALLTDRTATAASSGSTVAGAASLVPGWGVVAGVVSAGLVLRSTEMRAVLTVGAGGSSEALTGSVVGAATSVVGAGAGSAAAVGGSAAKEVGSYVATGTGMELEAAAWADQEDRGEAWSEQVEGLDGEPFDVTVHDVAEPWDIGVGLRGAGFAATATVPGRTTSPPRRATRRPTPAPRPAAAPPAAATAGSGTRPVASGPDPDPGTAGRP